MPTPSHDTHEGEFLQAIRNVSLALRNYTAIVTVYVTTTATTAITGLHVFFQVYSKAGKTFWGLPKQEFFGSWKKQYYTRYIF